MNKVYILALNYSEAKGYMNNNPEYNTEYIVLNRPEQLYGTINPEVIVTSRAFHREDYNEFIDVIRTRKR
jgi:hypothetical protein